MGGLNVCLALLLVSGVICTYNIPLIGDNDSTFDITWPSEYFFKGQTVDMNTGVVQPFRIWYSAEHNRSRMEIYDGEINAYFIAGSEDQEGGIYKVITVTTKEMKNKLECESIKSNNEQRDFLPDTSSMNNTQSYTFNGRVINEWKSEHWKGMFRVTDTLLVYRTEYGIDVPVSHDEKKYNLDNGRLIDHKIAEYYDFQSSVNADDLEIMDGADCEELSHDFPTTLKFMHPDVPFDVDTAFDGYKKHHKKNYKEEEYELRKTIFHKNWRLVENHNRKNVGYKLALNQFADRTDEELEFLTGTGPSDPETKGTHTFYSLEEVDKLVEQLPEEFDLRLKGNVRPVKQQGVCQSCWAFTAAATVEGAISYKLGGRNVDLSEQSLVDCSWGYGNGGCQGGFLSSVFKYVLEQGIPADIDYGQYKEADGKCHIQNLTSNFKIRGFGRVNADSVNSLKLALNQFGPVAVSIRATHNMKLYSSGVFFDDECQFGRVNHGVVVVGYGVLHGDLYWIVRNSWGEEWGEDGYILMAAQENNCFLLGDPYYVIV